ncbi:hypothetical protein [Sporosarcina sp.]|uniref:hypothetical protein n=1 Tax=Sporosarcina sp. TaxID=49982 RepID=UPI00261B7606|nr:hypothetical protein [Sporosarcina sp.]
MNELEDRQTGIEYFEMMIRCILSTAKILTERDVKELLKEVETNFQEGSGIAMTLADMWREEGMEKGLEKGLEKGMRTSLIEMIDQGLIAKFKKVPRDISAGIQELDIPVLKAIMLKIMSDEGFKSVEEVREYL